MSESEMQAELERFPVTLYKEQWLRILAGSPSLKPYSFLFRLGVVFADERLDLRRTRCKERCASASVQKTGAEGTTQAGIAVHHRGKLKERLQSP